MYVELTPSLRYRGALRDRIRCNTQSGVPGTPSSPCLRGEILLLPPEISQVSYSGCLRAGRIEQCCIQSSSNIGMFLECQWDQICGKKPSRSALGKQELSAEVCIPQFRELQEGGIPACRWQWMLTYLTILFWCCSESCNTGCRGGQTELHSGNMRGSPQAAQQSYLAQSLSEYLVQSSSKTAIGSKASFPVTFVVKSFPGEMGLSSPELLLVDLGQGFYAGTLSFPKHPTPLGSLLGCPTAEGCCSAPGVMLAVQED